MLSTLLTDFLLLCSVCITLNCFCILYWTLLRHQLKPAAWLQMQLDSLADFTHFLKTSWEICLEAGGVEAIPDDLAIQL